MKRVGKLSLLLLLALIMSLGVASGSAMAASKKNGIVTEKGVKYYYKNGKKVKNTFGVKYKGKYYTIDTKGVAKKVSNKALGMAYVKLTDLGITPKKAAKSASSKKKCLKTAFKWCYNTLNFSTGHNGSTAKKNAIYGFTYGKGNCQVQAATFYYLAKALGYSNVTYIKKGYVKSPETGKYQSHAWVTIKVKGKTKVFDPNFAFVYQSPKGAHYAERKTVKNGFWMTYGASGTYKYYYKKNGKYKLYNS